ncbi:MAG: hypothetical protein KBS57_04450, partial [Alistipes sp.]|nr:hypothetical protein [Candidatus Minthomonas equi]
PIMVAPETNVTARKRQFLKNAASAFVSGHGINADTHFDVVSVIFNGNTPEVRYIPDAFTVFD